MLDRTHAGQVSAAYRLGDPLALEGPTARGELGAVYRLRTTTGTYAVKEHLAAVDEEHLRTTVDLAEAARAEGVRVPHAVLTPSGDVTTKVGSAVVRVHEWWDLGAPDIAADPAEVGRVVAAVHRAGPPSTGAVDPWYTGSVAQVAPAEAARAAHDGGAPFARALTDALDEMGRLRRLGRAPGDLRLCHRDLWANNVLPAGRGLCVIDWDNAGPAGADDELAMVLVEFATDASGAVDARRARTLYRAYVDAGGPARVRADGDFTMVVCVLGNLLQLHVERWLASTDPAVRAAAEAGVREVTDRPLTLGRVHELLDVVAADPV